MDYRELETGQKQRFRAHAIHLDNRSKLNVTGVVNVESFHEQEVVLCTEAGNLVIEGDGLHMSKLNLDDGQIMLEGDIYALNYEPIEEKKRGLFGRIMR